ncbi:MAG TPA: hypothetical protein PLR37_16265 [Candidatus Accumulibacter phosphatis]|uniref:hypothetical protein n=1 Tax=Accumulibacter sp. TaxID=2053492 RepID=UPI0004B3ACCA|nr:hypothetical protein [Accumulibacter sp.]HRF13643.1 hypothetical protein [Candidatus Accumulibacter phosphatis]
MAHDLLQKSTLAGAREAFASPARRSAEPSDCLAIVLGGDRRRLYVSVPRPLTAAQARAGGAPAPVVQ